MSTESTVEAAAKDVETTLEAKFEALKTDFENLVAKHNTLSAYVVAEAKAAGKSLEAEAVTFVASEKGLFGKIAAAAEGAVKTVESWFAKDAAAPAETATSTPAAAAAEPAVVVGAPVVVVATPAPAEAVATPVSSAPQTTVTTPPAA